MINEITDEIRLGLKTYLIWVLTGLIDVVAVILWALFQYGLNAVIVWLELIGLTSWVFFVLQILSAVSTLAPITFFIYRDVRIMWIRTSRDIQREALPKTPEPAVAVQQIVDKE